jgi:hypothetical protein
MAGNTNVRCLSETELKRWYGYLARYSNSSLYSGIAVDPVKTGTYTTQEKARETLAAGCR